MAKKTARPKVKAIKPITAERFERELNALTRLLNMGVITAREHKLKYDVLVTRLKVVE